MRRDLFPAEVLVRGNRIEAVAEGSGHLSNTEDVELIDGAGKTLMPGMCNTHCHLTFNNGRDIKDLTALPVEEHTLLAARNAKLLLDFASRRSSALQRQNLASTS
jgi:imidazolonepropionase-like amidohydrolase